MSQKFRKRKKRKKKKNKPTKTQPIKNTFFSWINLLICSQWGYRITGALTWKGYGKSAEKSRRKGKDREKRRRNSILMCFRWQCQFRTMRNLQFQVTAYLWSCFSNLPDASFSKELYSMSVILTTGTGCPASASPSLLRLWIIAQLGLEGACGGNKSLLNVTPTSVLHQVTQGHVLNISKETPKRDSYCASGKL